jgi:hypothetical protein
MAKKAKKKIHSALILYAHIMVIQFYGEKNLPTTRAIIYKSVQENFYEQC